MKTAQKAALSLLITVVVFSAFSVFAFSGLFNIIETRFYNQRVTNSLYGELQTALKEVDRFNTRHITRFESILRQEHIQRSYLPNLSVEDIEKRENLFQFLKEELPGFLYVRFIDTEGNIHYSTIGEDIKDQNEFRIVYRRLEEAVGETEIDKLTLEEGDSNKLVLRQDENTLVYAFPFYDTLSIFKGTALFYVSGKSVRNHLLKQGVLQTGQDFSIIESSGLILRFDISGNQTIQQQIITQWNTSSGNAGRKTLVESAGGETYALLSIQSEDYDYSLGMVVPESLFTLNDYLKIILMASLFVTLFLLLFLTLSFRQDRVLVLSERIKRFQINFLREYIENKESIDWEKWKRELGARRELVKREIKRGIGNIKGSKQEEVDELIEKSWDDIIDVIGSKIEERETPAENSSRLDIKNLEQALERVLKSGTALNVQYAPQAAGQPAQVRQPPQGGAAYSETPAKQQTMRPVEVEEIESEEELEEVEESGEEEEVGELTEVEELEEMEEQEGAEDISTIEKPEKAGSPPAETLQEAEEEVETAEEMPRAGQPVEVEEISQEEADEEMELLEEMEEAEGVEDMTAVEEAEEAEEVEEAEEIRNQEAETAGGPRAGGGLEEIDEEAEAEEVEEEPAQGPDEIEEVEPPAEDTPKEVEELPSPDKESEEVEEIDEGEHPEEIEEAEEEGEEPVEEVEEVEETGEIEEPEPLEAEEPAEEVEELAEAEELEEVPEPAGEAAEAEEVEELEPAEELYLEPLQEAETELQAEEELEELSFAETAAEEREVVLEKVSGGYSYSGAFRPGFSSSYSDSMWKPPDEPEEPEVLEELRDREKNPRKTGESSIDTFAEKGVLEVLSAYEVISLPSMEQKSIIEEDKNGVFTLREDAIDVSLDQLEDPEFKKLADEVIGAADSTEDRESVIQDLFSFSDVELPLEFTKEERETAEGEKDGNGKQFDRDILRKCFTEEGLNLDQLYEYLTKHKFSPLKGLLKLSKSVDAVCLAVITYSNGSFTADMEIGFDNVSPKTFVYRPEDEIIRYVAEGKMYVYANYNEVDKEYLKPRLSDNDKKNLQSFLFFPAVYQNDSALVFMGFKRPKTSIQTVVDGLMSVDI